MDASTEKKMNDRLKRIEDAIALRKPDRVPFFPQTNFLAIQYAGISGKEAFDDSEKWFSACLKMNMALEPDLCWSPVASAYPGKALDLLGCIQVSWPGHGAPDNSSIQYRDKEYMRADEIDHFLDDPTGFLLGSYLPRVFGSLAPLGNLPALSSILWDGYKSVVSLSLFAEKEIADALKTLSLAIVEAEKYTSDLKKYEEKLTEVGLIESFSTLRVLCPFDLLGDYFRGVRGIMMDMYRQPEKLISALDKIQSMFMKKAIDMAETAKIRRVFMPLHLGDDSFMSPEQFETFYWPYLKSIILDLIDLGYTPCPFFEGNYTSRLHYLKELPQGKIMGFFDRTDLFEAKRILGDTMCIVGNVPVTLLQHGSLEEITEYSKKLIDIVGRDGGFVMSSRSVLDSANKDLVKAWSDFTKEYGVYK